ncbi:MAG: phosphonate metabolism protein PhnM [Hyphomicrobiales bacterium]|nr:MAG: phosphonate metabolism protein PhnM [Hyphomicrobiales bacterium]
MNTVFTNAKIITADAVIEGSLEIRDGKILEISTGNSSLPNAIDCEGHYLCPGFVELHTDNVERHLNPRPNSFWPARSAIINHDREIAGAGITTVFNALYVGDTMFGGRSHEHMKDACDAVAAAKAEGHLKADHFLHLRCEVSVENLMDHLSILLENDLAKLVSVMDHTPGQRQFVTIDSFKSYYQTKYKMSDAEFSEFVDVQMSAQVKYSEPNRRAVVNAARDRGIQLASHDDATIAHVDEAIADDVAIAEFPTTLEAAHASHKAGLAVMMGAPNIVRGKSHNGNASARDFAEAGVLDIISSDYVPASLLHACLVLEENIEGISLPQAISMVTSVPARKVGLNDRGVLAVGKQADIVLFNRQKNAPIVQQVWRKGERVA